MRSILLIFVAIFISFTGAEDREELHKAQEQCKEESGLDQEKFDTIRNTSVLHESDETEMKFIKCLAMKLGLTHEDGSLNKENTFKFYKEKGKKEDDINEAIKECDFKEKPDDKGVLAYYYFMCFSQIFPKDSDILLK